MDKQINPETSKVHWDNIKDTERQKVDIRNTLQDSSQQASSLPEVNLSGWQVVLQN